MELGDFSSQFQDQDFRKNQQNDSEEINQSLKYKQDANPFYGSQQQATVVRQETIGSNAQNQKLIPPNGKDKYDSNPVYATITPSESGGHNLKARRNNDPLQENNSSNGANTQVNNMNGKNDFSQGGTNFGSHIQTTFNDEITTKQHLEIQQGQPMRSLRSLMGMSNKLNFYRYKRNLIGLFYFLLDTFVTFDICILIFHIVLIAVSKRNDEGWNIIYCVAALNIIGQGAINIFHDQKLKQAADSVNKLTCDKFVFNRRHKRFLPRPWEDLHVGDIIKLKKSNQVPADCLILDIKGSQNSSDPVAYVKGGPTGISGETEIKRSCQNTQNKTGSRLSDNKFVQLISGQIKWEYSNRGKYVGSLKLNENPAAFEFKNEHILNRGSSLYLTEQIICMVLNIGDECLGSVQKDRQTRQPSLFSRFFRFKEIKYQRYYFGEMVHNIRILQIIALIISFLSWVMIIIVYLIIGQTPLSKFEQNIIQSNYGEQIQISISQIVIGITSLQSQYLLFYPYIIKIILDFVIIFHNYFILWDVNLAPANTNITNYFALNKLSQVSNMVLSPSTILGYRLNVVMFHTRVKEYQNLNPKLLSFTQDPKNKNDQQYPSQSGPGTGPDGSHQIPQNDAVLSDDSSQDSDDEARNEIDYLPISRNFKFRFENQNVADILNSQNKNTEQSPLTELLKYCCLCHSSMVLDQHKDREESLKVSSTIKNGQRLNSNLKSIQKFDEAQLSFASSFKFGFISRKGQILTIQVAGGKQELFEELTVLNIDLRGISMTAQIIRPYGSQDGYKIILKAPLQAIKVFMKEDLWPKLENDLQFMTKQGIQALTFAKKELDPEETPVIERAMKDSQTLYKGNKQRLQEYIMTQCENLDLIGTLGMKPYINYRNSMFMEEAHRNGIKIWLLSSLLEFETILQINAAEFLSGCSQPLNVKGQNERQVEESLKACLKTVSERMQSLSDKDKSREESKLTVTNRQSGKVIDSKNNKKSGSGSRSNQQRQSGDSKIKSQQLEVVFTNGYALQIIMKDESLLKIFLILCSLCNCVVGSQITSTQKAEVVRALKEFNIQANLGYVLSIIGSSSDMYMVNEADVKIGLISKYRSSDMMALTDMNVSELHALTYILFKHASHLNRRQSVVINFFLYRTILLMAFLTYQMIVGGLTPVLPFQMYYAMIFTHIITPFQYFLFGISHNDFGFDQFHRIFGEYQNNHFINLFGGFQVSTTILKALFDAFLICFFSIAQQLVPNYGAPVDDATGIVVSQEADLCYNSIVMSLLQLKRMRDFNSNIEFFQPFYILCFFLSVIFVLEDDNLVGLKSFFLSPAYILQLVMIALIIYLQETVYKVMRMMLPTKFRESLLFYKYVEEMIFMEEYEDSNQEFQISNNTSQTQNLMKQIKARELMAINQNMLRLHRSDSMDQILERINFTAESNQGSIDNKIVNRSTLLNKHTLKLNDFNKELEYQNQLIDQKMLEPVQYTLYSFIVLLACHIAVEISLTQDGSLQSANKVPIIIILASLIVLSAGLIIILKRIKDINQGRLLLFYIFIINIVANIQKSFTMNSQSSEMVFYSILLCSFLLRLNSFFAVSFWCFISMVAYCQLSFGDLLQRNNGQVVLSFWEQVEAYYRIANVVIFLIVLILYSYWDETTKKISFVINFRKQKEFQKSKQILNILVPSIVRSKIQEGQKNFSEAQGMVTIVFCDIEKFDELVQLYEGKELIELLDQTYNAFDQLCEQYGLQKIETVGKTYMACGGLKFVESKIDSRMLGNHFSVRAMDFAFEMLSVANSIKLKNTEKLKVKIGLHTGEVVTGVVGETKPQFSLIGDTVNKTSRVCSKCPSKQILISKETHKVLELYSNNFLFDSMEVFMKGIGTEKVYKVYKRGMRTKLMNQQNEKNLIAERIKDQRLAQQNMLNAKAQQSEQNQKTKKNTSSIDISNSKSKSKSKITSGTQQLENTEDQMQYQEVGKTERTEKTDGDVASDQHSQSDIGDQGNKQFGNFKEDKIIVNNPTLNIKYKLVERPRFLLQFNQKEQEQEFQQFISKYYMHETVWFLIIKACVDSILFYTIGWRVNNSLLFLQLAWVLPYVVLVGLLIRVIAVTILNKSNVVAYSIVLIILYFFFTFVINTCQAIFDQNKNGVYTTCKQQLESYSLLVFTLRTFQTRSTVVVQVFFVIAYAVQIFINSQQGAQISSFAELAAYICFAVLLTTNSYFREMQQRRQYNNERIIDIEIEKTEDLLSKLVPFHVLAGIKNDQRVVDVLDNVTLLYTDMVGFTQFSNNVKNPIEVVQLLSKLFSKFDQLTEAHGVYKVHTIGDCYVIMGYTGKTPKFRRTQAVQIEEAYRVVKVGLEMIDIIREVREASTDPNLRSLDMRIGIHTGKIVGGIIGTKVVRYDIFGQDVLIANKMESNGKQGCVCISESTYNLLKQNQFIIDTLDFTLHEAVQIDVIKQKIQSYLVEQIFMENSIGSSEELSNHEVTSNEDKDENGSENEYEKADLGFRETEANLYAVPQESKRGLVDGDKFIDPDD